MTWEQVVAEGLLGTFPQSCLRQLLQVASTLLLAPPPRVLVAQLLAKARATQLLAKARATPLPSPQQPQGGTLWGQENLALVLAILMQLELVLSRLVLLEECFRPLLVNLWLPQVLSRLIAHAGERENGHTCLPCTWLCRGRWRTHANAATSHHRAPTQWCPLGLMWALLVPVAI